MEGVAEMLAFVVCFLRQGDLRSARQENLPVSGGIRRRFAAGGAGGAEIGLEFHDAAPREGGNGFRCEGFGLRGGVGLGLVGRLDRAVVSCFERGAFPAGLGYPGNIAIVQEWGVAAGADEEQVMLRAREADVKEALFLVEPLIIGSLVNRSL